MAVIFGTDKRRIIPRWRSIEIASSTGELIAYTNIKSPFAFTSKDYLTEQIKSWNNSKDLTHAGDLLGSASVLGLESEFIDVAEYIRERGSDPLSPLMKLANRTLGIEPTEIESYIDIFEETKFEFSKYYPQIKKYKYYLNDEPKNPIAWIELGRLYSLVGQVKKAKKCIDAALFLDKNNRFIVRSASRFYHHFHSDKDNALHIIKNSEYIKVDPWLISAEIAYSSILERHSKMAKLGVNLLRDYNNNYLAITELASALGTLEFTNDKIKNARNYFKQSLMNPNDNSLAQASWMTSHSLGLNLDISQYDLPLAFEAKAHLNYDKQKYQEAFQDALKWHDDEPYSTRPIRLASYIASTFLGNNKAGIRLLRKGREINPTDPKINNNLVYYLIQDDQLKEAIELFELNLKKHLDNPNETDSISIIATNGLILYRIGEIEKGREYYQKAISLAKKIKNNYLFSLATVNYAKEELRFGKDEKYLDLLIQNLIATCKNCTDSDVKILYNKVILDYDTLKRRKEV